MKFEERSVTANDMRTRIAAVTATLPWLVLETEGSPAITSSTTSTQAISGDGTPAPLGAGQFTIPPTRQINIGLPLSTHHVS